LKANSQVVRCLVLAASLAGCKVYDQPIATVSMPATIADAGNESAASLDAASADAGKMRSRPVAQTLAADGGSTQRAQPRSERANGRAASSDSEDAGATDVKPDTEATVPADRPAADSGSAPDATCAQEAHCGHGWQRRLTLDGSQVSAALMDFPVLIRIDDRHLQEYAAAGGNDVYFTADDRQSLLDFEIESYWAGELVAWVRVPSLNADVDATLYLGYGDSKTGRAKPQSVWSNFHNVWHMAQDPSAGNDALRDSTERAHGTAHGLMTTEALVAGVAGPSLKLDGINDEISFINDLWGSGPSTFSGWVRQAGSLGQYGTSMISLGGDNDSEGSARFMLSHADDSKVKCGFYGNDDLTTAILPLDEWKYLTWTWDGSASAVYIDAVRVLGPASHIFINTAGLTGKLGNASFKFDYFMYGQLDELHIATNAHSSAWIAAEYANQRPGSSFIKTVGEPEPAPEH
jgi:hypothetical protein